MWSFWQGERGKELTILFELSLDFLQELLAVDWWGLISPPGLQSPGIGREVIIIESLEVLFQSVQLVLLFQEKPVVEPKELAVNEEIGIARLEGGKLPVAGGIGAH